MLASASFSLEPKRKAAQAQQQSQLYALLNCFLPPPKGHLPLKKKKQKKTKGHLFIYAVGFPPQKDYAVLYFPFHRFIGKKCFFVFLVSS